MSFALDGRRHEPIVNNSAGAGGAAARTKWQALARWTINYLCAPAGALINAPLP
jgi:hypothetical protein